MKLSRKFMEKIPGKGLLLFGIPVGQTKHLFDRYRNYLGWIQLPVTLYVALIQTVLWVPWLAEYVVYLLIFGAVGFAAFTVVVMYLDNRYVFPNEREFMYNNTPYFVRRFEELENNIEKMVRGEEWRKKE